MRGLWCQGWSSEMHHGCICLAQRNVSRLTIATWKALQSIFLLLIEGLFIWTGLIGPVVLRKARRRLVEAAILYSVHTTSRLCIFTVLFKSSVSSRKCRSIAIYGNSAQLQCRAWIALWWRPFRVVVFPWIGVIAAISTINVLSRDLFQFKPEHKYNHRNEICSDVHTILLNFTLDC